MITGVLLLTLYLTNTRDGDIARTPDSHGFPFDENRVQEVILVNLFTPNNAKVPRKKKLVTTHTGVEFFHMFFVFDCQLLHFFISFILVVPIR